MDQLKLYLYDTLLKNVESQKILGLHIDKNLTWKIHIDNLCKEVSKLIGLLWRNKHILPYSCRLLFYKAYILPKIDFCLTIWGKSSQTFLDRIWKLQKRAIRIVCDLPYSEPTRHVFSALKLHNIYERYFYHMCITVFKTLNTDSVPLSELLKYHSYSSYNLRSYSNEMLLYIPFPRKEIYKQSFSYSAPTLWNQLPDKIKITGSLSVFKQLLHNYISSLNVISVASE